MLELDIVKVIKPRRMRRALGVLRRGAMESTERQQRISVKKPIGRPSSRCDDIIKMGIEG